MRSYPQSSGVCFSRVALRRTHGDAPVREIGIRALRGVEGALVKFWVALHGVHIRGCGGRSSVGRDVSKSRRCAMLLILPSRRRRQFPKIKEIFAAFKISK